MRNSKKSNSILPEIKSRYKGCLIGLAVGDAVGATPEFTSVTLDPFRSAPSSRLTIWAVGFNKSS